MKTQCIDNYFVGFEKDENKRNCRQCGKEFGRNLEASQHLESHGHKILHWFICCKCENGDSGSEYVKKCTKCGNEDPSEFFHDFEVIQEEHTEACIDYNFKYESDTPGLCICEDD